MNGLKNLRYFLFLLFSVYSFASEINIALSANMSFAIKPLIDAFQKTHDTKITYTIGSSGKLTAQITKGAPYDLFLSANLTYPKALYHDKKALTPPVVYAKGSLALFSTKQRDFTKGLKLLQEPSIKKIAIANPKTAPYGVATVEALKHANLYKDIKQKLIYGESISQTVAYSKTATDIGIIATSALFSDKLKNFKKGKNWIELDKNLYTPISQAMVLLKDKKEAKEFFDFLQTKEAKEILKRYGYIVE